MLDLYGGLKRSEVVFKRGVDGLAGCRDPGFAFADEILRFEFIFPWVSVWVFFMEVA